MRRYLLLAALFVFVALAAAFAALHFPDSGFVLAGATTLIVVVGGFFFADWLFWIGLFRREAKSEDEEARAFEALEKATTASVPANQRGPARKTLRTIAAANGAGGDLSPADSGQAGGGLSDAPDASGRVSLEEKKD